LPSSRASIRAFASFAHYLQPPGHSPEYRSSSSINRFGGLLPEAAVFFARTGHFIPAPREDAMSDRIPMTRKGYDKLKADLEQLEVEFSLASERVGAARAEGDLSENAEYHGARETQGMIQAKINLMRDKLNRATIVDTANVPRDEVAFGCTVVVKDLDFGDEESFTLVGAGEEDYDNGKILFTSPLAQGLVGHKKGAKVKVDVPAGTLSFEIVDIRFDGD
jgi:transcription elongation factor GreA